MAARARIIPLWVKIRSPGDRDARRTGGPHLPPPEGDNPVSLDAGVPVTLAAPESLRGVNPGQVPVQTLYAHGVDAGRLGPSFASERLAVTDRCSALHSVGPLWAHPRIVRDDAGCAFPGSGRPGISSVPPHTCQPLDLALMGVFHLRCRLAPLPLSNSVPAMPACARRGWFVEHLSLQ